jgi:hypothetical protein
MKKIGPVILLLLVLLVGAAIGYVWGAYDVDIASTGPWQMDPSYQGIYVQSVADAFAKDANEARAIERLSFLCQTSGGLNSAMDQANKRYGADPVSKANLDQLSVLIQSGKVTQNDQVLVCNTKPIEQYADYYRLGYVGLLLVAILIVVYGVMVVIRDSDEAPAATPMAGRAASAVPGRPVAAGGVERGKSTAPAGTPLPAGVPPAKSVAAAGAKISATLEKTDFTGQGVSPPIVQFMTTYLHGDDLYDDSFSIETSSGEFLGETGVGISETINSPGEAKKVTCFEVWLFDKNDIRTVTKVLMSDHAFNDDAIRGKLAAKGEAVLIKAGDKVILETATLRVQARIVDLSYGTGPVPPNSFFERITIELAAWKREGAPAPAGGGTPPSGLPSI